MEKKKKHNAIRKDKELKIGDVTSAYHLKSKHPWVVPQVNGRFDSARLHGATVFAHHFLRSIYAALFQCPTNEETLEAKHDHKNILHEHNHLVKAYRAENRRFSAKPFADAC